MNQMNKIITSIISSTLIILIVSICSACIASDLISSLAERKEAWQDRLKTKSARFDYVRERLPFSALTDLLHSLASLKSNVEVHVVCSIRNSHMMEFRLVENEQVKIAFRGHMYSTFRMDEKLLYFCQYGTSFPGCTVIAYSVETGKEVWRTKLHQKSPSGGSGYYNRVNMQLKSGSYPRKKVEDGASTLLVWGSESYCDYIEALDAATGEYLGIRNYRVGFPGQKIEPLEVKNEED